MHFPRQRAARTNTDAAVLPLTNVVFLLLIFFMLAGHLAVTQPFDIQPPKSSSQAAVPNHGLHIEIAASGAIALDGRPIALRRLISTVHERLAANPHTPLEIKADGRNNATHIVAVMHALHTAGAHELRLVTVSNSS